MYLATSFNEDKACEFWYKTRTSVLFNISAVFPLSWPQPLPFPPLLRYRAFHSKQVPVHWVMHTLRYRCKNVNLVEKTVKGVEDEQEYLFVPCALPRRPNANSLTLFEKLLCIHHLVRPHSRQNHR
jgi:hypothetical protein